MKLVLKSFMENVPLTDPTKAERFLVFDLNGTEFKVPTGPETIKAIVEKLYGSRPEVEAVEPPSEERLEELQEMFDEPPEDAEEFGGDVKEGEPEDEDDPISRFELPLAPREVPTSEEEVPSL